MSQASFISKEKAKSGGQWAGCPAPNISRKLEKINTPEEIQEAMVVLHRRQAELDGERDDQRQSHVDRAEIGRGKCKVEEGPQHTHPKSELSSNLQIEGIPPKAQKRWPGLGQPARSHQAESFRTPAQRLGKISAPTQSFKGWVGEFQLWATLPWVWASLPGDLECRLFRTRNVGRWEGLRVPVQDWLGPKVPLQPHQGDANQMAHILQTLKSLQEKVDNQGGHPTPTMLPISALSPNGDARTCAAKGHNDLNRAV